MKRVEDEFKVSRETLGKLQKFVDLVLKWNQSINLISKSTEAEIWERHVLDSLQIVDLTKKKRVLDIGTGAGFPGVVLSIVANVSVILVEKNSKKCTFLHKVRSEVGSNFEIINQAIEDVSVEKIDVITCRGFASVEKILELTGRYIHKDIKLVLLKGENYKTEVEEARKVGWSFSMDIVESITNKKGAVLTLSDVRKNG
jgi:16S rRNA (guanine527-N7)-methyltransferase